MDFIFAFFATLIGIITIFEFPGVSSQFASTACRMREFRCSSGAHQCLLQKDVCDGVWDCEDGEDEGNHLWNCTKTNFPMDCRVGEIRCSFGGCVPMKSACDGTFDCWGGSDEAIENCAGARPVMPRPSVPDSVRLSSDKRIVPISGLPQLKNACRYAEFRCTSGDKCILLDKVCNGVRDCPNGDDELGNSQWNCSVPSSAVKCQKGEFRCPLGGCVKRGKRCNGVADCWGGMDEDIIFCSSTRPFVVI